MARGTGRDGSGEGTSSRGGRSGGRTSRGRSGPRAGGPAVQIHSPPPAPTLRDTQDDPSTSSPGIPESPHGTAAESSGHVTPSTGSNMSGDLRPAIWFVGDQ